MSNDESILLGAVAYDPKVVTIWEGIREHFQNEGVPLDFALFSNYERPVEELLKGHIDIAWNTPLAHVQVKRRTGGESISLGMRDRDRDFHAKVIVRRGAGIYFVKGSGRKDSGEKTGKRWLHSSASRTHLRAAQAEFYVITIHSPATS